MEVTFKNKTITFNPKLKLRILEFLPVDKYINIIKNNSLLLQTSQININVLIQYNFFNRYYLLKNDSIESPSKLISLLFTHPLNTLLSCQLYLKRYISNNEVMRAEILLIYKYLYNIDHIEVSITSNSDIYQFSSLYPILPIDIKKRIKLSLILDELSDYDIEFLYQYVNELQSIKFKYNLVNVQLWENLGLFWNQIKFKELVIDFSEEDLTTNEKLADKQNFLNPYFENNNNTISILELSMLDLKYIKKFKQVFILNDESLTCLKLNLKKYPNSKEDFNCFFDTVKMCSNLFSLTLKINDKIIYQEDKAKFIKSILKYI